MTRRALLLVALVLAAAAGSVATSASNTLVTIGVRPSIMRFGEKPEIFGAVTSTKADEEVTVQFRQCGLYPQQFRDFMTTQTTEGGAWNLDELFFVGTRIPASGTFRALWNNELSREVKFQMRVFVDLTRLPRGRGFYVRVYGDQSFWHRRVRVERFNRRLAKWNLVRSMLLTKTEGSRYYGGSGLTASTESFHPDVPKGTTLRAVLPLAAAKPCYLGGYSKLVRT